jgi:hypothetical protein
LIREQYAAGIMISRETPAATLFATLFGCREHVTKQRLALGRASYMDLNDDLGPRGALTRRRRRLSPWLSDRPSSITDRLPDALAAGNSWASELGSMASKSDDSGPMTDLAHEASRRVGSGCRRGACR